MKKNGFVLLETLIATTLIATVLGLFSAIGINALSGKAKKAMGFDRCYEAEYAPGIYGVGSVKNINGVESMVFLYFDKNDKFMYGAAVIPNKAYTFSQLESMIKKSQGKAIISLEKGGQKVVEWYNEKENVVYALIGSDKNDTMYGAVDFSNSNIRTGEDPETALQNILSMLG